MGLVVAISIVSYIQLWSIGEPGGRLGVKSLGVQRAVSRPYNLTPLFTWNTKQLFVYIIADCTNEKRITNEVVLWDRIVRRKRDTKLNIESARGRYSLKDPSLTF
ncbi:hypothetical protein FRC08_017399, partial [Ceratobasidium sp. 394]